MIKALLYMGIFDFDKKVTSHFYTVQKNWTFLDGTKKLDIFVLTPDPQSGSLAPRVGS